jgi:hypothetical protein
VLAGKWFVSGVSGEVAATWPALEIHFYGNGVFTPERVSPASVLPLRSNSFAIARGELYCSAVHPELCNRIARRTNQLPFLVLNHDIFS